MKVSCKGIVWQDGKVVGVVGNLVRVHHSAWHLDRAHKVEVIVTLVVSEFLNFLLLHVGRVLHDVVVDWQSSGNSRTMGHHVEVK